MGNSWHEMLDEAAALWRESRCAIALTGAGISVPSGIPDFRSPEGLWAKYDPNRVASIQALRRRPGEVWAFLKEAVLTFSQAAPNPAHLALARLEAAGKLEGIITQNIDGLHQKAGSANVVEFHGAARRFYCMGCKQDYDPALVEGLTDSELPWTCERCGAVIRPDFVFFGEHIPGPALAASLSLAQKADLAVIVGTSGAVAPANTLSHQVKGHGGKVLEINLGKSEFGSMPDAVLHGPAEEILPALADYILTRADEPRLEST